MDAILTTILDFTCAHPNQAVLTNHDWTFRLRGMYWDKALLAAPEGFDMDHFDLLGDEMEVS